MWAIFMGGMDTTFFDQQKKFGLTKKYICHQLVEGCGRDPDIVKGTGGVVVVLSILSVLIFLSKYYNIDK